jgi:hypothetical protein
MSNTRVSVPARQALAVVAAVAIAAALSACAATPSGNAESVVSRIVERDLSVDADRGPDARAPGGRP